MKNFIALVLLVPALYLNACAFDVTHVKQTPAEFRSCPGSEPSFDLEQDLKVSLGTGYSRTLKKGTRWQHLGRIPLGDVYESKDQILTVEASNIYEAWIVVSAGRLVGFYLPVEKTFSPLPKPKTLSTRPVSSSQ